MSMAWKVGRRSPSLYREKSRLPAVGPLVTKGVVGRPWARRNFALSSHTLPMRYPAATLKMKRESKGLGRLVPSRPVKFDCCMVKLIKPNSGISPSFFCTNNSTPRATPVPTLESGSRPKGMSDVTSSKPEGESTACGRNMREG